MCGKVNPDDLAICLSLPSAVAKAVALVLLALSVECVRADQPLSRPFKVAAIQFNPTLGILQEHVDALAAWFEQAAAHGAKIIVAPERHLSTDPIYGVTSPAVA